MLTLPVYEWVRPTTLDELLAHLRDHAADSLVVAGGTDAVPNLKHRLHEPRYVVSIAAIRDLDGIRDEPEGLSLGPLVRLAELAAHPAVLRDFPGLARAASLVASPQIRNMGTLGGNLCLDTRCTYYNQTYFWREALGFCLKKGGTACHVVPQGKRCVAAHSSDVAPMLIALGATVDLAGASGVRTLEVDDFFVGDGVHNNVLQPGEVVTRVFLPAVARGARSGYRKLRPRAAIDFPMLSVAFATRLEDGRCRGARLVVSAIAAKPRVIGGLAAVTEGQPLDESLADRLAAVAHQQCKPLINVPYDREYRQEMVPVYVRRAVRDAMGGES